MKGASCEPNVSRKGHRLDDGGGLDQVPLAAPRIAEHGDFAIGLAARRLQKFDAGGEKARVVAGEIVGLQKIGDPAAGGFADRRALGLARRLRDDEARALAVGAADQNPAFAVLHRGVFEDSEANNVAKPCDRFVIIRRQKGDGGDAGSQAENLLATGRPL